MLSISKNNWIKNCSNAKPERQAFAQFARSCMHNASMSLFDRLRLTVPSEGSSFFVFVMRSA